MNNKRIILNNYSSGTFGSIFKIHDIYIYKVTKISDNNILNASNINEIIFFNFLKAIKKKMLKSDKQIDLKIKFTINLDEYDDNSEYDILIKDMNDLISVDMISFKSLIDENKFIQSLNTEFHDYESLHRKFIFNCTETKNSYTQYLFKRDDKIVLFSKLPYYKYNLSKFIEKNHTYTVNNFESIAKKILKDLLLLHHNGFLHGDLKSANILINNCDDLSLTDFGAIKLVNYDKYHLSCTISARCPEDLEYEYNEKIDFSNSNYKSDIWSLGLIFAEMILGYNPILKYYKKIEKIEKKNALEQKILMYYKTMKYVNIMELLQTKKLNNKMYKYISIIEKMLMIDPSERISTLDIVYENMFSEKINYSLKINYNYDYGQFNINNIFSYLYTIRKENYKRFYAVCDRLQMLFICPLVIDIMDRLIIKTYDNIINNIIEFSVSDLNLLFCVVILLVSGITNQIHPSYDIILLLFGLKTNSKNILDINSNLLEILYLLDYDIYRPFNIYYCYHFSHKKICDCNNKNNTADYFIINSEKQKEKLLSILNNIVDNDIVGMSPDYYYKELLL
jgi:serine/threonine protein kinase